MTRTRNNPETQELSVVQLLGQLKPPQLWGFVAVVFGTMSGTFSLGYKISDYSDTLEIKRLQTTVDDQKTNLGEFQARIDAATIRQRFVSDYERYLLAAYKAEHQATPESINEARLARSILADEIYTWWKEQRDSGVPTTQQIAKGFESTDSRIIFMNGQSPESIWVIPPEIKYEVLQRH